MRYTREEVSANAEKELVALADKSEVNVRIMNVTDRKSADGSFYTSLLLKITDPVVTLHGGLQVQNIDEMELTDKICLSGTKKSAEASAKRIGQLMDIFGFKDGIDLKEIEGRSVKVKVMTFKEVAPSGDKKGFPARSFIADYQLAGIPCHATGGDIPF
ncbi:MAG: hypothetical protein LLG40_06760 [Deltaproteobacteria bacterium]|nr:hypothetical protein [Deltaproteobacteria bacterium]